MANWWIANTLSPDEEQELQSLSNELAALDELFYGPLIEDLQARIKD